MMNRIINRIISIILSMILIINFAQYLGVIKQNKGLLKSVDVAAAVGTQIDVQAVKAEEESKARQEIEDHLEDEGITLLPSLEEYYEAHGGAPRLISYAEFQEKTGVQENFDLTEANKYRNYQIRIDHKEDLFSLSTLCNSTMNPNEQNFLLSANYILGNNIDFNEGDFDGDGDPDSYFVPIGTEDHPFVGTFDGMGFEVRGLLFDTNNQNHDIISMFDVIGQAGTVRNFGMYSVAQFMDIAGANVAVPIAFLANKNYGTIEKVYCDLSEVNPTSHAANITLAGLVMENSGTLTDCYFAGAMNMEGTNTVDPICYTNTGTIENAYYDSTIFGHAVSGYSNEQDTTVKAATTVQLKTLGLDNETDAFTFENDTEDTYHWHIINNAANLNSINDRIRYHATRMAYPKLYGFISQFIAYSGTNTKYFEISTPADLIYFPQSYEYTLNGKFYFQLTNDLDMSYVPDDAYVPAVNFWGIVSAAEREGLSAIYNGSYSLINFRITQCVKVSATDYRTGLIAGINGNWGVRDSENNLYPLMSNINFIGGGIELGDIDFDRTKAPTINIGIAIGNVSSSNVKLCNIHSSVENKLEDNTIVPKINMGSLFGYCYNIDSINNITNTGKVYAGYHPNYDACNYSGSNVGGIGGYLWISNNGKGTIKTVVNCGDVIGLGIYDTMSSDPERASATLINETVNCWNRAYEMRVGGIMGHACYLDNTVMARHDYVVNYGNIYDVPYKTEEVNVYAKDGTVSTESRPIGIVPENQYIINRSTYLGGISGTFWAMNRDALRNYFGFDETTQEYVEDTGFKGRTYNFGNITAVESRSAEISGLICHGGYLYRFINGKNFGDLKSYTYSSVINGLINMSGNTNGGYGKAYYCDNYGDIYVDHSSRSARRTLYATYHNPIVTGGISNMDCHECMNYGNVHVSYNEFDRGERLSATANGNNGSQSLGIYGVSYLNNYFGETHCTNCINYGNLTFDVFDRWTGRYNYNELTEDKWYNRSDAKINNSYMKSLENRFFTSVSIGGVGYDGMKSCVNNGDISIEGTPYELLDDNSYGMVKTFQELCQKWGKDYGTYYNSSYGFVSDANIVRYQNSLSDIYVYGIANSRDRADHPVEECINNGNIIVKDSRGNCNLGGISFVGVFTDCLNRGEITFESKYNTGNINISGIGNKAYKVENCANTGDLYIDANDFPINMAGIAISAGSPSVAWEMNNCVNLGNITCRKRGTKYSNNGNSTLISGGICNIDIRNEIVLSGCANYGKLTYDADYEPSVKTGSTQYTSYWDDTIATLGNTIYNSTDNCYIGGIIRYANFGSRSNDASFTINSCLNHGDIDISWKHLYPRYGVYAGGIIGSTGKGTSSVGGNGYIITNAINHGKINFDIQRDSYFYQTTNFTNSYIGGIVGSFYDNYCNQFLDTPLVTVLENLVNTGAINVDTHGNTRNLPNVGGLTGYFWMGNNITISGVKETCHDYVYVDRIIDYQSRYRLIANNNFNDWSFYNNDNTYDEPLTVYGNNTITSATGIINMHKLILGENIYSSYQQSDTYAIGGGNFWVGEAGSRERLSPTTYTVKKLTVDDIYPTETTPELLQYGYTNPVTGVICSMEYLNLAGLSEKYRDIYRSVNGISYTPKPEGDEGDEEFTASDEYQAWANQKGGYVLRAAEPAVAGEDYIPDNIIFSDIKPAGYENWHREIYKNGQTYNEGLYLEWSQVNLLDLKEILSIILTDGDKKTVSYRRAVTENENIFYVYVPEGMTGTLEVDSFKISSKAEAVFYDDEHNVINNFKGHTFTFNGGEDETVFYATVTAQNQTEKEWKIVVKEYDGSQRLRVSRADIAKSKYAYANNNEILYTQEELEEAKTTLNFWDTPLYCKGGTFKLYFDTINIVSGYVLGDHMKHYYYPQNGYGITDYGLSLHLDRNSDLAELLASSDGYTMDEYGDVYKDGRMVLELLLEVNLQKDETGNPLFNTDGDILKVENDGFTIKAEKYSCYKGNNTGNYYLENEANNILWSFITEDGVPISRSDENFYTENGAYKRQYTASYLNVGAGNKVKLNTGEGEEDGLLMGTTSVAISVNENLPGGYFETEFTMPDGTTRSLYYAKTRDDEARYSSGYNNSLTEGYEDGQWISSESARQRIYDAHGAYQTRDDAHDELQDCYDTGREFSYSTVINRGNIFDWSGVYFTNTKDSFWRYFQGFVGNSYYRKDDRAKPYYTNSTYYSNGTLNRISADRFVRNSDGTFNYMDAIIQDTSEDLGLTRYHVAKFVYPAVTPYSYSRYTKNGDEKTPVEESVTIDGTQMVANLIPKSVETTTVKNIYATSAGLNRTKTFFAVQYCKDGETVFGDYHRAQSSGSSHRVEFDVNDESTALTINTISSDSSYYMTAINENTLPGYYKITPICAQTEYIYAYNYEDFIAQLEADDENINLPCIDKSYTVERVQSVAGYDVYEVTFYMEMDSVLIHKQANDDCYLKNVFMQDEEGENILSVDSDIKWDNNNTYAASESQWNANHVSVEGKEDTIRYKDGYIRYNADPEYSDEEQENYTAEKINAFEIYTYTKAFHTVSGQNQRVEDAYLKMQKSYLPLNGKLYYLNNGDWVEVDFDNNGNVVSSQQEYFHYTDFYETGAYKMFKVKAENGNTTYYKINAVTNKRDKGVHIVLSDDNDTEEALAEIKQKYGTFVSDMHLVTGGVAMTSQVGIYDETGAAGNNYCQLKFGNYDFTFNVLETAGYTYELCYTINNREVDLKRSSDDPNAFRLPLRIGGAFVAGQDITVTIKIKKNDTLKPWGRMVERLVN